MITAKEWGGKRKTEVITLPSGAEVEVKKSKLRPLLLANILPYELLSKVLKGKQDEMTEQDRVDMISASFKLFELITQTVVSPKICIEGIPKEDEISIMDIPDEDIDYLRGYIMGTKEAHDVEPFRAESASVTAGSSV